MRVLASVFDAPIALVSVVDGGRQRVRACIGLGRREAERVAALLAEAGGLKRALIVDDLTEDSLFGGHALLARTRAIRFSAGVPLAALEGGEGIGLLCVADSAPRAEPSSEQLQTLADLAAIAGVQIELGRRLGEQVEADALRGQLAAIVDSSDDAILGKTLDGMITNWNRGAERLYGYLSEEIVGKPISTLVPPDRPDEVAGILERVRRGEAVEHLETVRVHKDGRRIPVSVTISPIRNADGGIVGASTIARDISERMRAEAALAAAREAEVEANRLKAEQLRLYRELADHDPLTGVLNRRASSEAIERYIRLSERYGQPLSLALLDIDHFKQVNDRYGHLLGDAVLRRLAELMTEIFRGEDVVSRWGGEEFAIAMYGMGREHGVRRLEGLLDAFSDTSVTDGDAEISGITFTAGVAEYKADGDDLQALYRRADEALLKGKAAGRTRVVGADGQSSASAQSDQRRPARAP